MKLNEILGLLNSRYAIEFVKLEFLRDGGCVSYIVYSSTKKFLLKIIKSAFMDTAKQSVDILLHLEKYNFPVPKLIMTTDSMPYFMSVCSEGEKMFVIFEFIEGREPKIGEKAEQIGELVGNLHRIMESYNGYLTVRDKSFFIERYISLLRQKSYPENKLAGFIEYGDLLWDKVKDLPRGYCHGDLHCGNMMYTPSSEIYLFDFDTSCNAFPMFDIMVICDATDYFTFKSDSYDIATRVYERFLSGYTKHRTLTDGERMAFYDLIAVRHYQLQATIIEILGLDCVDEAFIDNQFDWLCRWREQCDKRKNYKI